ncbi:hypothetical protein CEXT_3901 [Caerostris extrusa]|uniref:Uncharacterized protein n=1 Tax=Caerostris extrusa TaxID=172846 RepID=A0AAV4RN62_CAEEX|nr:hypothetical protein CEXT_3901 [Caerostris extrusa]
MYNGLLQQPFFGSTSCVFTTNSLRTPLAFTAKFVVRLSPNRRLCRHACCLFTSLLRHYSFCLLSVKPRLRNNGRAGHLSSFIPLSQQEMPAADKPPPFIPETPTLGHDLGRAELRTSFEQLRTAFFLFHYHLLTSDFRKAILLQKNVDLRVQWSFAL